MRLFAPRSQAQHNPRVRRHNLRVTRRFRLHVAAFAVVLCGVAYAALPAITVRFLSYPDVETLPGVAALESLAGVPASGRPAAWDAWVRQRAADVHARLLRGEEDSLAYLLVFGTSFTAAPRVTREFLEQTAVGGATGSTSSPALQKAFDTRLADCLRALAAPGADERLSWAAATMVRLGHRLDTPDGITKASEYLLRNLSRVLRESTELSRALASAQGAGDRDAELAQRARVFARRGLAPDTSWPINFALADALQQLKDTSTLAAGSVRRIAIVGPGLDFVDKDEGQDYYPPQSLQPFAVMEALLASGLAIAGQPAVTTIDISSRVNGHLARLVGPGGRRPVRPAARPGSPGHVDGGRIALLGRIRRRDRHRGRADHAAAFGRAAGRPRHPPVRRRASPRVTD